MVRKVEAERRRANLGMGVDGRGGSALETGNPLAQAKEPTPLLRSVSHVATLWAELFDHRQQVPQNEAMTASTAMARGVVFEREREDAFSASSWSTELGEFVASSQAMPAIRAARTSADAWVAGELRTRGLAARHAQPATAATCGANSSPGGQPMTTETMAGNTTDATEPAPIPTTPKGRDLRMPSKTDKSADRLAAEVVVSGLAGNARTTVSFGEATFGELSLTECASVLNGTAKALNDGDLGSAVTMLAAQAVALNAMFGELARVGQANMFKTVDYADRYLRLAFKAQSQCRATLETLAAIKNPPVMFARQANINNGGHQQVNNGQAPTAERYAQGCASAHPGEFTSRPNELLEDRSDGSTQLDSRATAAASSKNQGVGSVGALNWPAQR